MRKLLPLLLLGTSASALVVSESSVQKQLAAADLVAEITIEARRTVADPTWTQLTIADARLDAILRDDGQHLPGDSIQIRVPGGELAGVGMMLPGMPRPYLGHRYRVHLKRFTDGTYRSQGFEKGWQDLSATRSYTRNRTDGSNGEGSGPFLFWDPRYFPIPYYLSAPAFANLAKFATAIDASVNAWSAPSDVKLSFLAMGCSSILRNANDGINSIILIADVWPFDTDAIAITRNFYVADDSNLAGMILDSDILLNSVDHAFTTTNETGKHDVQNIVTHEVGHFIGLGHETNPIDTDATMYAVASANEFNKRVLHPSDLAGLRAAYSGVATKPPVTRSTDSCALAASGNTNFGCASVHRDQKRPEAWAWLLGVVAIIWGLGRVVRRGEIA